MEIESERANVKERKRKNVVIEINGLIGKCDVMMCCRVRVCTVYFVIPFFCVWLFLKPKKSLEWLLLLLLLYVCRVDLDGLCVSLTLNRCLIVLRLFSFSMLLIQSTKEKQNASDFFEISWQFLSFFYIFLRWSLLPNEIVSFSLQSITHANKNYTIYALNCRIANI